MEASSDAEPVARWRHRIRLPDGSITPGTQDTDALLAASGLPQDLSGLSVLDIGCSDGFYSFECERRGAAHVLAVDNFSSVFIDRADGFFRAKQLLDSNVDFLAGDLFDLRPAELGRFDVVLFLGVLYHLRHPLLGLDRVADLCAPGGLVILESEIGEIDADVAEPFMQFVEDGSINHDPTNWWIPSIQCVAALMRSSGLERVDLVWHPGGRALFHGFAPAGMTAEEARSVSQVLAESEARRWHQDERWR